MTAAIIAFQAPARRALAGRIADYFLPVVRASVELLKANEQTFEARCRQMLGADGETMIENFWAEIETVGRQMRLLADGLDLTRARLRTAMARLATVAETS